MSDMEVLAYSLEYVDPRANSEKFYNVYVVGSDLVTQYGRIGSFGTFGRKPQKDANAAAERAVAGKVAKGYNIVASGILSFDSTPSDSDLDRACSKLPGIEIDEAPAREQSSVVMAANDEAEVDPLVMKRVKESLAGRSADVIRPPTNPTRPMLAKEVTDVGELSRLIYSDSHHAQPKLDGDRVVIEVVDGEVRALNRSGQPKVKNIGSNHLAPFLHLTEGRWVFDGEIVGRTLHVFDLPAAGAYHDESATWLTRLTNLNRVGPVLFEGHEEVKLVATARSAATKRELLDSLRSKGGEGVIFRDATGAYESGKRSSVLIKHKFLNEADCIVTEVSPGGKDSVVLSVYAEDDELLVVGQASTIGKSPSPKVGDVWEVRFLYIVDPAFPRMVQPRLMRKRIDKTAEECSIEQFASAVTNKQAN